MKMPSIGVPLADRAEEKNKQKKNVKNTKYKIHVATKYFRWVYGR